MDNRIRHTVKDSVFTLLFSDPRNALRLYQALHPEDSAATVDDCELLTLRTVLVESIYNDFGMMVRGKLIILMEAQSVFTRNIALRILLYLAETYDKYVKDRQINLYSTAEAVIPRPELYMVYVGPDRETPEVIRLSELYEDESGAGRYPGMDLEVKVIRKTGSGDILDQYVRFCEVVDAMRGRYGNTLTAVKAILKQCLEEGILTELLLSREKEVETIMMSLYDEETIRRNYEHEIKQRTKEEGIQGMVKALKPMLPNRDAVIQALADGFQLPLSTATEKVEQYWG